MTLKFFYYFALILLHILIKCGLMDFMGPLTALKFLLVKFCKIKTGSLYINIITYLE